MESYAGDQDSMRKFGVEVVTQLCQTLLDSGAPGIHFYTMNQVEPTREICNNLNL
jgi:methylenetetrahydrofolate reductase (NADPH)